MTSPFMGLVWKLPSGKFAAMNIGGKIESFEVEEDAEKFSKTYDIGDFADEAD